MHPVVLIACMAFMAAGAYSDLRDRKITNRLNLVGMITGVSLQLTFNGPAGVVSALQGFAVGLLLLFVFFAAGMIGGGDVKFAAAIGTFLGWRLLLIGLGAGAVLGGIVGAVALLRSGRFKTAMRGLFSDLLCLASGVRPVTLKSTEAVQTVPYGVLLAVGLAGAITADFFRWIPWASR
jgi:prepilin peptidase CpaA